MSTRYLEILQHSLGVDRYGKGDQYRSHFVTGVGSVDHADCMELVSMGLMSLRGNGHLTGGDDCFVVTKEGREYVLANSPSAPKLTRSQQRYERFLAMNGIYSTFGEFLKSESAT